jgi:hypothetical protein
LAVTASVYIWRAVTDRMPTIGKGLREPRHFRPCLPAGRLRFIAFSGFIPPQSFLPAGRSRTLYRKMRIRPKPDERHSYLAVIIRNYPARTPRWKILIGLGWCYTLFVCSCEFTTSSRPSAQLPYLFYYSSINLFCNSPIRSTYSARIFSLTHPELIASSNCPILADSLRRSAGFVVVGTVCFRFDVDIFHS